MTHEAFGDTTVLRLARYQAQVQVYNSSSRWQPSSNSLFAPYVPYEEPIEGVYPECWALAGVDVAKIGIMGVKAVVNGGLVEFTGAAGNVTSLSFKSAFDGELYPASKLQQLVKYLERRGVAIYGTTITGRPTFIAFQEGGGQMLLPRNPTVLQVKHELSHYLDYKRVGFEAYSNMSRFDRELSVLNRLQQNRSWNNFNDAEKSFSIDYVNMLTELKGGFTP